MSHLPVNLVLLLMCSSGFIEATVAKGPRMIFEEKGKLKLKLVPMPGHQAPVRILLDEQPDSVTAVGPKHVISLNFKNPSQTPEKKEILKIKCDGKECNYNITMVHRSVETNQLYLSGERDEGWFICAMNLSAVNSECVSNQKTVQIEANLGENPLREGDPSAFVESGEKADLYVTYSGTQGNAGIHKFGLDRVGPAIHDKEQYYVGLMPVRDRDNPSQDKVYGFYRERNRDASPDGAMWIPYVTRVCMSDAGGPKNNLQFHWTSQVSARLFCGDAQRKQHFPKLVDVATVPAERWRDTRVYGLFRNEWGMSAVCVYTMEDIDRIFTTSEYRHVSGSQVRPRTCTDDSQKTPLDILKIIEKTSEMKDWVQPVARSGLRLCNHYKYTQIHVDPNRHQGSTVVFLTVGTGQIHKAVHHRDEIFVIAEYGPFGNQTHIKSLTPDASSRKLYVSTEGSLVQLDVADCRSYGDRCEDCVMARDPYCGWSGTACTPRTNDSLQDVSGGNHSICPQPPKKAYQSSKFLHADESYESIHVAPKSSYFLRCPVGSHNAQYSWVHGRRTKPCEPHSKRCLLLIDSMDHEHEGTYRCMSEEEGFQRELIGYKLMMGNSAVGQLSGPLVWVCVMAVLIRVL